MKIDTFDDDLALMFGFSLALRQNSQSSPKNDKRINRELISHSRKKNSKQEFSQKSKTFNAEMNRKVRRFD